MLVQLAGRPARHESQAPHLGRDRRHARADRQLANGRPDGSAQPTNSWPMMTGGLDGCPAGTFMIWTSDPQTPQASTSTRPRQARASDRARPGRPVGPPPRRLLHASGLILLSDDPGRRPFSAVQARRSRTGPARRSMVSSSSGDGRSTTAPPLRHCATPGANRTTGPGWSASGELVAHARPGPGRRPVPRGSRPGRRWPQPSIRECRWAGRRRFDGSRCGSRPISRQRSSRTAFLWAYVAGSPRRSNVSVASDDPKGPFLAASPMTSGIRA